MGIATSRIALLAAEPEIARFMTEEERAGAERLSVPVRTIPRGPVDLAAVLGNARAFGAIILEGMLFTHPRVGDQIALRLLGPGDALSLPGTWRSSLLQEDSVNAAVRTRLALLGNDVLVAARRWPHLVAGLHVRLAEQTDRLAAQLAICQLPRVEQRLLAVMWLLAESWGQMTSIGTRLPLNLTHDSLGALIGARRPTVTLALGELTERGAIVRQGRGWLLVESPVQPGHAPSRPDDPVLLDVGPADWGGPAEAAPIPEDDVESLLSTVARLREEHIRNRERVRERLRELADARRRVTDVRARIAQENVSRRGPPS